jgi:hypothetical protein
MFVFRRKNESALKKDGGCERVPFGSFSADNRVKRRHILTMTLDTFLA